MLNKTKIFIIDFEDSFTFNIANVLFLSCQNLEVINYKLFFTNYFEKILTFEKIAIILGPGPGHPQEYSQYFVNIKKLLAYDQIYLMGICLGHQLICSCLGYQIKISKHALHGEKIIFYWNDEKIIVQRYNSLAVVPLAFDQDIVFKDELMILNYRNGRSYQFHPESIATDNSPLFFNDLLTFIQKE